ncbi:MAG TPA: type II toxin-antitoxin system Phd/YefM family antitoxin [Candidatus Acidoferrum sp.]|nr:type II toxin-antitoxin system Phd/YefM family antitoxin [Candidatus Acidoferrum sp.]
MKPVNTHEAKTQFSRLLQRVIAGEEITIANRGVPVARLVPVASAGGRRKLGLFAGQMSISQDFDAPLPEELIAAFEGNRKRLKKKA